MPATLDPKLWPRERILKHETHVGCSQNDGRLLGIDYIHIYIYTLRHLISRSFRMGREVVAI